MNMPNYIQYNFSHHPMHTQPEQNLNSQPRADWKSSQKVKSWKLSSLSLP